jgi:anti-anti-sigma factor
VKNGTFGFECDYWMQSSPDTLLVYMRGQMVYEMLDATDGCWQAVRHAFRRSVLLDLSQVTYMASAALGSLCGLRRWLESQGSCLRIVAISTEVRSIMEASGLLRIFSVDDGPIENAPWIGPDSKTDNAAWIRSGAFQNQEVVGQ